MFLYSTVIELTPEVCNMLPHLGELGYKRAYERGSIGEYLVTTPDIDGSPCYYTTDFPPVGDNIIDCGENHLLWADIVALRDDSDKYQVFILHNGCVFDNGAFLLSGDKIVCVSDKLPKSFIAHKASLNELYAIYEEMEGEDD